MKFLLFGGGGSSSRSSFNNLIHVVAITIPVIKKSYHVNSFDLCFWGRVPVPDPVPWWIVLLLLLQHKDFQNNTIQKHVQKPSHVQTPTAHSHDVVGAVTPGRSSWMNSFEQTLVYYYETRVRSQKVCSLLGFHILPDLFWKLFDGSLQQSQRQQKYGKQSSGQWSCSKYGSASACSTVTRRSGLNWSLESVSAIMCTKKLCVRTRLCQAPKTSKHIIGSHFVSWRLLHFWSWTD